MTPKRAYSYIRFSTPDQLKGDSERRQIKLAQDYARENGLELDDTLTFQDLGVSAFRGLNVAAGKLGEFLEAVQTGKVEPGAHLLVEALDRISRDQILAAQTLFQSILLSGVTLHTLQDRKVYSAASVNANPADLIMSIVILMAAHDESSKKSKRMRAAWDAKRARVGEKKMTSKAPAWLTLKDGRFRPIADRERIVQRVFSMALQGAAPDAICKKLNAEGVPTMSRGRRWHRSYIVRILDNPAVIGTLTPQKIEYDGRRRTRQPLEPVANYFPAVIERATWDRVQAMRTATKAPLRGRHANGTVRNILGGLAECPECGASMTRVTKAARGVPHAPKLVCSNARSGVRCSYRSVNYADVERALIERRKELTRTMPGANERARELEQEIDRLTFNIDGGEDQLETLTDQLSRRPSRAVSNKIEAIERERDAMLARRRELLQQRELVEGAFLKKRLVELQAALGQEPIDLAKANARLRQLLKGVIIDYRSGQLGLQWQHGGESTLQYAWPDEKTVKANPVAGRRTRRPRPAS